MKSIKTETVFNGVWVTNNRGQKIYLEFGEMKELRKRLGFHIKIIKNRITRKERNEQLTTNAIGNSVVFR